MRYSIAFLLAIAGTALAVVAMSQLGQNDPYTRLFGLLLLSVAIGLGLWSLVLLAGAKNRIVTLLATLAFAAIVVISMVFKCMGGDLPFCKRHALTQPRVEADLSA